MCLPWALGFIVLIFFIIFVVSKLSKIVSADAGKYAAIHYKDKKYYI
jgi:hypothetical protein